MAPPRPKILFTRTALQWALELAAAAALMILLARLLQKWPVIPEEVPRRFDLEGRASQWGSRAWLWLEPALGAALYLSLSILRRFPHVYNYPVDVTMENAPRLYRLGVSLVDWVKFLTAILFASAGWRRIEIATGATMSAPWLVPALCAVILIIVAAHAWLMSRADGRGSAAP